MYSVLKMRLRPAQEPGRRWFHRRRVQSATQQDLQRLQDLEASLSTEEVVHFRCAHHCCSCAGTPLAPPRTGRFCLRRPSGCAQRGPAASPPRRYGIAATHNSRLAGNPALAQAVADKLDATGGAGRGACGPRACPPRLSSWWHVGLCVLAPTPLRPPALPPAFAVCTRGALTPRLQDVFLHRDRQPEAPGPGAQAAAPSDALFFGLRVTVACPKLGFALCTAQTAAQHAQLAGAEAQPAGGADAPPYVAAMLHGIHVEVDPAGERPLPQLLPMCGDCCLGLVPWTARAPP